MPNGSFYPRRAQEREKTLEVFAPCCGAKLPITFDGTGGEGWERSTELPVRCPRNHVLSYEMREALHSYAEEQAVAGVGDYDPADVCWHSEAQR